MTVLWEKTSSRETASSGVFSQCCGSGAAWIRKIELLDPDKHSWCGSGSMCMNSLLILIKYFKNFELFFYTFSLFYSHLFFQKCVILSIGIRKQTFLQCWIRIQCFRIRNSFAPNPQIPNPESYLDLAIEKKIFCHIRVGAVR